MNKQKFTLLLILYNPKTNEIYTLSLHDALPISDDPADSLEYHHQYQQDPKGSFRLYPTWRPDRIQSKRSEEHTSELQSRGHLVCRLLLEKKKIIEENRIEVPRCVVWEILHRNLH